LSAGLEASLAQLQRRVLAGREEQARAFVLGSRLVGGTVLHLRFEPARPIEKVRVHVQSTASGEGGGDYDAVNFTSDETVDCRGARVQNYEVTLDPAERYFVWVVPLVIAGDGTITERLDEAEFLDMAPEGSALWEPVGTAAATMAAHLAVADPHPQYLTPAEGAAAYDALGAATAAIAAHLAASDPHTQYHTDARGDARYSLLGHTHTFASLTAKPTTLAGYGITDAASSAALAAHEADTTAIHGIADTSLLVALNAAGYTAGDMLYYAAGTGMSKLGVGAADRIMTSTGSAPQWVASLTKAQQHAQTAYLDGTTAFSTNQQIQAGGAGTTTFSVRAASTVGGAGSNADIQLFATSTIRSARFLASNASSVGNRYVGINVEKDHDGNRLPFRVHTWDTTDSNVVGLEVGFGTSAGHVRYGGGSPPAWAVMFVSGTTNTDTTQGGLEVATTCNSSATVAVFGTRSVAQTAVSAFTTATLASVWAKKPVLGAGSAATLSASAYVEDGSGVGSTSYSLYVLGGTSKISGNLMFDGGHFIRKEVVGTATDWEFWHGLNTATYPNFKVAQGSAGVFNVPVSTGLANALTLTAPYNAAANWPVLSILKYQTCANNPSDFISCAQTLDNGATFTYPFRVLSCGTAVDTSGIVDMIAGSMTAAPTAASTAQFLTARFTTTVAGGASATFAGAVSGLTGEAILDPTSAVGVTGQMIGTFGATTHNKAGVTLATGRAVYAVLRNTNTGTITTGSAFYALVQATSTGPITTAHAVNANVSITAAATIATYYGVRSQAAAISGGGAITTAYGGYFEAQNVSGVGTAYTLYATGGNSFLLGQVLVGTTGTLDAAAALQVESTTKGLLFPRMTTTQRDAIASPPNGLLVYNSTTGAVNARAAGAWVALATGSGGTAALLTPDSVPTSPSAYDYEFDGTSSGTLPTGWSWLLQQTGVTYRERVGVGVLTFATAAKMGWIERAFPSESTWDIYTKITFSVTRSAPSDFAFFLKDATGKAVTYGFAITTGTNRESYGFVASNWTSATTWNAFVQQSAAYSDQMPLYLRLRKVSSTSYTLYVSADGEAWTVVFSGLNPTFIGTPTTFGIMVQSAVVAEYAVHYFRLTTP
jgi:hypothetical protein